MAFTLAIHARLPKKYAPLITTLFRAYPEVLVTRTVTLVAVELRLLWGCCTTAEVPRLLTLMRKGSHGTMAYTLKERPPGTGGPTVQLSFHLPDGISSVGGHAHGSLPGSNGTIIQSFALFLHYYRKARVNSGMG
jgi:hypothetical protein